MVKILGVELPIFITKVIDHNQIKNDLLKLIDQMPNSSINSSDIISKTDWNLEETVPRSYLEFIKPRIIDCISKTFSHYGYPAIVFTKFWYQQYINGDIHDWHVHSSCHYTNVYFVDLPDKSFKTEIQSWDRSNLIPYDIEEGDIITFPSILYHRSPKNYSNQQKTIISFNIDLLSSKSAYYDQHI